jgi:hypothetical protein
MNSSSVLISDAKKIAAEFRLGKNMQASESLAELVTSVGQQSAHASTPKNQELSQILKNLLDCHKNDDWLGVADYLEFELVEWMHGLFTRSHGFGDCAVK